MAYITNIPQATDDPSLSQAQFLNNFNFLGAIAGNGAVSSDSINATSGFNWIYLPPNGAIPPAGAAFTAGNIGLYSALDPITGQNELYINKRNQATVVQSSSTASILSTSSAPATKTAGWTRLPSGMLLKWDSNLGATGNVTRSFPVAATIPAFTTCMAVYVTLMDANVGDFDRSVRLIDFTATTINVYGSFRTTTGAAGLFFNYLAIGY